MACTPGRSRGGLGHLPSRVRPNPDRQLSLPVHQILLVVNGIHLLENMKLDELSAKRVYEFAFVIEPLKIQGEQAQPSPRLPFVETGVGRERSTRQTVDDAGGKIRRASRTVRPDAIFAAPVTRSRVTGLSRDWRISMMNDSMSLASRRVVGRRIRVMACTACGTVGGERPSRTAADFRTRFDVAEAAAE